MSLQFLAISGLVCLSLGFVMGIGFCQMRGVRDYAAGQIRERELQGFVAARTLELSLANKELKQARSAADEANQAKSLFIASMSHDLRTPLNAIIGFSDLMLQETFGPVAPERYREYLVDVKNSGEILLELLNNILDLSKLEAGRRDVYPTLLDGEQFARECLKLVRRAAETKQISLQLHATGDCRVFVDELAGREILLNLLTNAVKFTAEGGEVCVWLNGGVDHGTEIIVSDTGIGMDEAGIRAALEPFRQAHRTSPDSHRPLLETKNLQGSGLGLPITARLIDLHGGKLTIISSPGQGTKIRVWLPGWADEVRAEPGQLYSSVPC